MAIDDHRLKKWNDGFEKCNKEENIDLKIKMNGSNISSQDSSA